MFDYTSSQIAEDIDCASSVAGLVAAARDFYARGWALGASGNFSAHVSDDPFPAGDYKERC